VFIRRTAHVHRHPEALAMVTSLYSAGHRVVDIARRSDVNFSPYLLVRILIEDLLDLPKGRVADYIKQPALIRDARLIAEVRVSS
jgi:hypothetical protein